MGSFTVDQFCQMHGFSRAFFYKLAKQGHAPRSFKVGASTRISETAAAEWLKEREAAAQVAA
jgi:predicted DNA-binding transcriptional regulator AlpA